MLLAKKDLNLRDVKQFAQYSIAIKTAIHLFLEDTAPSGTVLALTSLLWTNIVNN